VDAFRASAEVRVAVAAELTGAGRFDGHRIGTLHITADAGSTRV
jgi:hypothetical protein